MQVKLNDVVCRINNNIDRFNTNIEYYLGKGHGECGELAITEHGNLKDDVGLLGFKFHFGFKPQDTLFFSRSFTLHKAGMATYEGICSDSTYILRTKDENVIDPFYLPIVLQKEIFWDFCDTHHTGGVNFLINWSTLADYEFELPPLEEQKRIARKAWSAYRLKESYKRLLTATQEMVKSQFIEMFGSCDRLVLNKVASITKSSMNPVEGTTYTLYSFPAYDNNQIPEVIDGGEIKSSKLKLEENVVLFNKLNVRLSRVWNINKLNTENNICSSEFLPIKVSDTKRLSKSFLYRFLCSDIVTKQMVACSTGTSNSQKRINPSSLMNIDIPLPPMEQQQQFVTLAEHADKSVFDGFKSQFIEMFGNTETKPLVDVCIKSGEYGSNTSAIDYNGITRYVRITDITDSGKLNDMVASPKKVEDKYRLNINDLLFARTGNTVGKTYLHKGGDMIFAGYLIRYKLNERVMLPQFAFSYTHTQTYYDWVEKTKKVGAQPNISATQYDEMPIPVPPMELQQQFVALAEHADKSVQVA